MDRSFEQLGFKLITRKRICTPAGLGSIYLHKNDMSFYYNQNRTIKNRLAKKGQQLILHQYQKVELLEERQ